MGLRHGLITSFVLVIATSACSTATADNPGLATEPEGESATVEPTAPQQPTTSAAATLAPATTSSPTTTATTTTTTVSPYAPPSWLGTRLLELRPDGFGIAAPTPPELIDRQFATPPLLAPPTSDAFESSFGAVPTDVAARSSWTEECPVSLDELSYLTMSHFGFDGEVHTGEMIVNATFAEDVVGVFEQLFAARFPIEEMRVTRADEIDAPPTGDRNVTGSFGCRPAVNSGNWSQHAFGLAIDINPFHNPYVKGDLVIPELASYYIDRTLELPGMVETANVVEAFSDIGWSWGGDWNTLKDWMHFSLSGH